MKRKIMLLITIVLILGFSVQAYANLVNNGTYATDTVSGLDWYNMTLTSGLSYQQTQAALSTFLTGWQIASSSDVSTLFADSGLPANVYEATGYASQVQAFAAALGADINASQHASQYVLGVAGFYGPDWGGGLWVDVANAMLTSDNKATIGAPNPGGGSYSGYMSALTGAATYAPYLVRPTSSTPVPEPVPEPATLLLFGTGLAGMAAIRRRLKQ